MRSCCADSRHVEDAFAVYRPVHRVRRRHDLCRSVTIPNLPVSDTFAISLSLRNRASAGLPLARLSACCQSHGRSDLMQSTESPQTALLTKEGERSTGSP
jgi:hypothetical protein